MRDDPRNNLKWLEQELLAAERPAAPKEITDDTAELLAQVDDLLDDLSEPEPPVFVQKGKRQTMGEKAERQHITRQFDEDAAVLTKTRGQIRKEKRKQKRESVNRNIKGLVVLAVLEIIGILCILGWWFQ
ncbi:MAG: hypothetical protein U0N82_00720 [Oscillospiraceae bacterium]